MEEKIGNKLPWKKEARGVAGERPAGQVPETEPADEYRSGGELTGKPLKEEDTGVRQYDRLDGRREGESLEEAARPRSEGSSTTIIMVQ